MLLSTTEYTFKVFYLPGIKNILADFGTRYINISEWDTPPEDDQEGLHELFCFDSTLPSPVNFILTNTNLSIEDQLQLQAIDPNYTPDQNPILINVRSQQKIYVPILARRPIFWLLHKEVHPGASIILKQLQALSLYWPHMSSMVETFLSQCICAVKKNKTPHKYSEIKHILASHPLHILAIDLYTYNHRIYFTAICLYSKFCWVMKVKNKMATTILQAYTTFCQTYAEPTLLSCDNGGEFEHITTTKIPHPSEHPQANGVIERFHEELGKISRIFNEDPDVAFRRLNTTNAKLIFHTYLKNTYHDCFNCLMFYETRSFKYNDLVWRRVPPRKRAKHEDTFTGPHRVLFQTGTFTYTIKSHLNNMRTIPVNLNDIKILHIPCTRNWQLNPKYIPQLLRDLNSSENFASPLIDFLALDALVLDILEGKSINVKFFIIPDWPCAEWYKTLHEQIIAEAVKLPNEEDLFVVKNKNQTHNLGKFSWNHWLFELRTPET